MAEDNILLSTMYATWHEYHKHIQQAIAPLTAEQLALRAAPNLRSIAEIVLHIVGCRVFWFTTFLGEQAGEEMQAYARWNRVALDAPYASSNELTRALGAPVPTAAELADGLDHTWQLMADCLARWSPADMRQTFRDDGDGTPVEISRAWVAWHVIEHDLHHGGELSLTLGIHGLPAQFPG